MRQYKQAKRHHPEAKHRQEAQNAAADEKHADKRAQPARFRQLHAKRTDDDLPRAGIGDQPFDVGGAAIDPVSREAKYAGGQERLQPQTLKVLIALARRRDQVVTRSELVDSCWTAGSSATMSSTGRS